MVFQTAESNVLRVLLLMMFMVPASALAQCKARTAEPFEQFIASFGRDKQFAVTRTEYPLVFIRHEDVDGNQDGRVPIKKSIEKNDDASAPAIADFARDNDVELRTTSLRKAAATVQMAKPGTDSLILDYHFVRKGACWHLRRIEDHSL